ncbi:PREDICTED: uncharacterized protein LOC109359897 [Lupinus angustifolius]|uniref:uncharacterized protein LOC109359897 n=1 Tax=Lupinus angustifolius TaxID=3871 RepID=UPI00092F7F4C|nr:PREDICTED: uncharacterized protein LOC109359897 [Lupinus angustifolius]
MHQENNNNHHLTNPSLNPCSSYYLHPGENPGFVLVSPPLDGMNYNSWSRSMRKALGSKNKYKFVNGNIKMPSVTDPIFEAWERCNNMVVSWITRSLSPQIAQSAVYIDGAQDLWQDLKERFPKGDYFRTSDLLQEIHSIRQGDQSVSAFFTDLKTIWEELDALRPLIPCICDVKCSCESMKSNIFYRESEYVICFLKGLNDQYRTIKAQILLMEPLPSMNKCFSLVIQQERQMDVTIIENQSSAINNINTRPHWRNNPSRGTNFNPRPSQESNKYTGRCGGSGGNSGFLNRGLATSSNRPKPIMASNKICTFCGRENHTLETYYFKHGFPPTFKPRQRQMDPAINSSTSQDNTTVTTSINNDSHSEKDNDQKVVLTFNPTHQINQTSSEEEILPHSGMYSSHNWWILDTGATDHITNEISHYSSYSSIKPMTIRLPNGASILAKHSGIVAFSTNLHLTNVLHIPGFTYNLISIHKLTTHSNCTVVFDQHCCFIQDTITLRMIGLAEVHNHLYIFRNLTSPTKQILTANTSVSALEFDLWHFRLGHPSKYVFDTVCKQHPYVKLCANKTIRSDNGKEILMSDFYANSGIVHQTSCVETPEKNSIVERKHRHILNVTRLPTPVLQNKSLSETLLGQIPILNDLKVFGCLCYGTTNVQGRTKLDPRAKNAQFYEHIFPHPPPIPPTIHPDTVQNSNNFPLETPPYNQPPSNSPTDFQPISTQHSPIAPNQPSTINPIRRSQRPHIPSTYLRDFHCSLLTSTSPLDPPNITHPLHAVLSYHALSPPYKLYTLSISANIEPKTYQQAISSPEWTHAMKNEIQALEDNSTWTIVPLLPRKKAIGSKWVYKLKFRVDGTIDRHKARLVAKGFNQTKGLDFVDTFAPVVKLTTI